MSEESKQPAWMAEIEKDVEDIDFGLEVYNGMEYVLKMNLDESPSKITINYEGNETEKWQFAIELLSARIIEPAYLEILKSENEKKWKRITTMQPKETTLNLTKRQTSQLMVFLSKFKKFGIQTIKLKRSGKAFKTKYNFYL